MMSRLFNSIRKELFSPLVEQPRMRFSSGTSGSSSSSSASKTKPELTKNEERTVAALKAMAVFLPGVYIGHVLTKHEIIGGENAEHGDGKDDKKDGKDDKKDGKDDKKDGKADDKKDGKAEDKKDKK